MTVTAATVNRQVRLAARPVGLPTRENWSIVDAPIPEPVAGGVLVKTLMLSLDPAMRGWMRSPGPSSPSRASACRRRLPCPTPRIRARAGTACGWLTLTASAAWTSRATSG